MMRSGAVFVDAIVEELKANRSLSLFDEEPVETETSLLDLENVL
jgi:hypothetical protein